jgi:hypothetical protein
MGPRLHSLKELMPFKAKTILPYGTQYGFFTGGGCMSIRETIASAGKNLHTIIITAREDDGSVETREAEPYSYRMNGGDEKFYCYDIRKNGIRNFHVSNIISVEETTTSFVPRWPVEV